LVCVKSLHGDVLSERDIVDGEAKINLNPTKS